MKIKILIEELRIRDKEKEELFREGEVEGEDVKEVTNINNNQIISLKGISKSSSSHGEVVVEGGVEGEGDKSTKIIETSVRDKIGRTNLISKGEGVDVDEDVEGTKTEMQVDKLYNRIKNH